MADKKPGPACGPCSHPKVKSINADLVSGMAINAVARKYGLHEDAMHRHNARHLSEERRREIAAELMQQRLAKVDDQVNGATDDLNTRLDRILTRIDGILARAEERQDDAFALAALKEERQTLSEIYKIRAGLKAVNTVSANFAELPQTVELLALLARIFKAYPDAGDMFLSLTGHLRVVGKEAPWIEAS